jgi:hypothetical protein
MYSTTHAHTHNTIIHTQTRTHTHKVSHKDIQYYTFTQLTCYVQYTHIEANALFRTYSHSTLRPHYRTTSFYLSPFFFFKVSSTNIKQHSVGGEAGQLEYSLKKEEKRSSVSSSRGEVRTKCAVTPCLLLQRTYVRQSYRTYTHHIQHAYYIDILHTTYIARRTYMRHTHHTVLTPYTHCP